MCFVHICIYDLDLSLIITFNLGRFTVLDGLSTDALECC